MSYAGDPAMRDECATDLRMLAPLTADSLARKAHIAQQLATLHGVTALPLVQRAVDLRRWMLSSG